MDMREREAAEVGLQGDERNVEATDHGELSKLEDRAPSQETNHSSTSNL